LPLQSYLCLGSYIPYSQLHVKNILFPRWHNHKR
jgi:hypothetical protein